MTKYECILNFKYIVLQRARKHVNITYDYKVLNLFVQPSITGGKKRFS